jgi:Tfp pilus assembly protein PilN
MDKIRKTWHINLLPKDKLGSNLIDKTLSWATTYGRYIIVLTEFVVILVFLSRFKFDQELTDLHEEIAQKRAIVKATTEIDTTYRALQNRLAQIKNLKTNLVKSYKIFEYVNQNTPPGVFLKGLNVNDNNLSLSAVSYNEKDLIAFVNAWLYSPDFEKISLNNISTSKKTSEPGIQFSLTAKIKPTAFK